MNDFIYPQMNQKHLDPHQDCVKEKAMAQEVKPLAQDTQSADHRMINRLYFKRPSGPSPLPASICPPETRGQQRLPLRAQTPLISPLFSHLSIFLKKCPPVLSCPHFGPRDSTPLQSSGT